MAKCPICGLPYEFARLGWTYRPKEDAERFVIYVHTGGLECRTDDVPEDEDE